MITVFVRTIMIYFILLASIRLMGKRQIGELQITEFVVTFMLSELATMPIINKREPFLYAVVPIFLLLSLEVIFSFITLHVPPLKRLMYGSPGVLICKGKIMQSELAKNRIDVNELLAELRLKDVSDPADVEYAILEENGKLSVIKKASASPAAAKNMELKVNEPGIAHPVIIDGKVSDVGLKMSGKTLKWLESELRSAAVRPGDVYLMTVDDCGKSNIVKIENSDGGNSK